MRDQPDLGKIWSPQVRRDGRRSGGDAAISNSGLAASRRRQHQELEYQLDDRAVSALPAPSRWPPQHRDAAPPAYAGRHHVGAEHRDNPGARVVDAELDRHGPFQHRAQALEQLPGRIRLDLPDGRDALQHVSAGHLRDRHLHRCAGTRSVPGSPAIPPRNSDPANRPAAIPPRAQRLRRSWTRLGRGTKKSTMAVRRLQPYLRESCGEFSGSPGAVQRQPRRECGGVLIRRGTSHD